MVANPEISGAPHISPELTSGFIAEQIVGMEAQFTEQGPVYVGEINRRAYIESLPASGFTRGGYAEMIDQVAAIGLPVDNFNNFIRRQNLKGTEDENYLASWGIGASNYGEFSVYDLHNRQAPQERLATITHESAHANTPLVAHNARLYGGEAERLETAEYVHNLADQSLATGVWLNGYHAYLAEKLEGKKIDRKGFDEETFAIATELGMTNRGHLAQVQERQHQKIDDLARIARIQGLPEPRKVSLLSEERPDGSVTVTGIDKPLITLIDGVSNFASFKQHLSGLKHQFYPDKALAVAVNRGTANTIELSPKDEAIIRQLLARAAFEAAERARLRSVADDELDKNSI
jgi:hypothetical protein